MTVPRRLFLLALPAPFWSTSTAARASGRVDWRAASGRRTSAPVHRGINLSGAEFTPDAAHLPGVCDRDYAYPSRDDLRYVARCGHRMVRLPLRWERLQPGLMGPLQPDELRRLLATVDQAAAVGLRVLVDVHNYARYITPADQGGATLVLGDGRLTEHHLADLWSRLSVALRGRAGVLGYGLMNEPHDLPGTPATAATGTIVWGFDDGPGSWSGEADATAGVSTGAGTVREGRASLRVVRRLPPGRQDIRVNDSASNRLDPAAGGTLSAWVLVPASAPGTGWTAQLEMQDGTYRWRPGPSTPLVPGRWANITCTPDATTWSQHRGVAVQLSSDQGSAATAEVYVDSIRQGTLGRPAASGARQWERASQLCVDAIRANQDRAAVYVSGVGYSGAQTWPQNHPAPWVRDPAGAVVYEAHYYVDRDNSGTYRNSFADEDADARRRGYTSLQARAATEIGHFLWWCRTHEVRGFLGELGWAGRSDAARWNAVGDALYRRLDTAGMGAAYWAAGPWYGSTYDLSAYTGTPLAQRAAPAAIIEAHPSRL